MLHSKIAMFRSAQAVRAKPTARISSERLHDNNGSGGVDQDFQTIESIHHEQNVEC